MGLALEEAPPIIRIGDGLYAQVEDRSAPLPRHLDASAHVGRIRDCRCRPLLEQMTGLVAWQMVLLGTRLDCRDDHDYRARYAGRFAGLDLALRQCRYCGTVEVRDRSLDLLVDTDGQGRRRSLTPLSKAKRRDTVLGHYTGRRLSGRIHT